MAVDSRGVACEATGGIERVTVSTPGNRRRRRYWIAVATISPQFMEIE